MVIVLHDTCAGDGRTSHSAGYRVGGTGEELLNAFQGPCQKRGIRCSDVGGTVQLTVFQRV